MSKHIRNFWVEGKIDGRESKMTGGPISKTGGLNLTIYQRENNAIATAFEIECKATYGGTLITSIFDSNGNKLYSFTTRR
jgi:hypothetical protein